MAWNSRAGERSWRSVKMGTGINSSSLRETTAKTLFIDACCGNGRDLDAGLRIFTNVVESRMKELENILTNSLNVLWGSQVHSSYLERQFVTSTRIVHLMKSMKRSMTIDDIISQLVRDLKTSATDINPYENSLRHLVFATIGWSSMLYTASIVSTDADFSTISDVSPTHNPATQQVAQLSKRPIWALFRIYGVMPIICPPKSPPTQGIPTLLPVTHLNFFSLSTLGDVTITWVNDLSKHCDFDRYNGRKDIKLFRLPSLCASVFLNQTDEILIGSIFASHICQHNCSNISQDFSRQYLLEVLLSYRLLFGQHYRSRQAFRESEGQNARWNGELDPLLEALCATKDVRGFTDVRNILRQRNVYNAPTEFPHLAVRLMELADYTTDQRPRNLVEVWNDQRDPERLLTFKAVLIIGGITILLGVLQLAAGIAQVVVSA